MTARGGWFLPALLASTASSGLLALALAERGVLWPPLLVGLAIACGIAIGAVTLCDIRRSWSQVLAFGLLLAWFGPGYDALLYGSDATVYYAQGAHVARTGRLWTDDSLLAELPHRVEAGLFPSHGIVWGAARSRSAAGLVFEPLSSRVYSTFSQLPSILLAFGWRIDDGLGAVWVTPFLAAGGVTAFLFFTARHLGPTSALLATILLSVSLPQTFFARLPMAEAAGQFLLWGGLLAFDESVRERSKFLGTIAGLGLGSATLARPEYLAFLPLAATLVWLRHPRWRPARPVWATAVVVSAYAVVLLFAMTPTHYREPARNAMIQLQFWLRDLPTWQGVSLALMGAVVVLGGSATFAGSVRAGRGSEALRVVAALGVGAWVLAYLSRGGFAAAGQSLGWMPAWAAIVVAGLTAIGLPRAARGFSRSEAGSLALGLAAIAAFHFLLASHTATGSPLWAARRLLPIVLPVAFAAIASACRIPWWPAPLRWIAAVSAIAVVAWSARPVWNVRLFDGARAATDAVAALTRKGDVVVIDSALTSSLLEVPLLLVHGRTALASRGLAGQLREVSDLASSLPDRPMVLLRHTLLPHHGPGEPVGSVDTSVVVPGGGSKTRLAVTAYRLDPGDDGTLDEAP